MFLHKSDSNWLVGWCILPTLWRCIYMLFTFTLGKALETGQLSMQATSLHLNSWLWALDMWRKPQTSSLWTIIPFSALSSKDEYSSFIRDWYYQHKNHLRAATGYAKVSLKYNKVYSR